MYLSEPPPAGTVLRLPLAAGPHRHVVVIVNGPTTDVNFSLFFLFERQVMCACPQ
jgi:hypothetical protein